MGFRPIRRVRAHLRHRRHDRDEQRYEAELAEMRARAFAEREQGISTAPLGRPRFGIKARIRGWQHRQEAAAYEAELNQLDGPWHVRTWRWVRWSSFRALRAYRGTPRFVQLLTRTVVLAVVAGLVALPFLADDAPVPVEDAFADLALDAPPGARRLLLAGDLKVFTLQKSYAGNFRDDGAVGAAYTPGPCGIVDGQAIVFGKVQELDDNCATWADQYARVSEAFEPDVAILMVGTAESFDRVIDGEILKIGTPEHRAYLVGQLEQARAALTGGEARLLLTTAPCSVLPDGKPDPGLTWVNEVWADYAADHADKVTLADLDEFICPDGQPGVTPEGDVILEGREFTRAGAAAVWAWIAAESAAAVGDDPAARSTSTSSGNTEA